jgi:hypothetical protein
VIAKSDVSRISTRFKGAEQDGRAFITLERFLISTVAAIDVQAQIVFANTLFLAEDGANSSNPSFIY